MGLLSSPGSCQVLKSNFYFIFLKISLFTFERVSKHQQGWGQRKRGKNPKADSQLSAFPGLDPRILRS